MRLLIAAVTAVMLCGAASAGPTTPVDPAPATETAPDFAGFRADLDLLLGMLEDNLVRYRDDISGIPWLTETHGQLAATEDMLLNMRSGLQDTQGMIDTRPDWILVPQRDGSLLAMPRQSLRAHLGDQIDASDGKFGDADPIDSFGLFDDTADILDRSDRISRLEDEIMASQNRYRARHTELIRLIDEFLAQVRNLAVEIIAARDELVQIRDQGAGSGDGASIGGGAVPGSGACAATAQTPNPNICLYQSFPLTGYASLLGFDVSPDAEYPLRGNYVCVSNTTFWIVEGSTMRHYVCDTSTSCRETRCLAVTSSTPSGSAYTRYMLENGAVMVTERSQ